MEGVLFITVAHAISCSQLDRSTVSNVVKIMAHYNLRYVEDLSDYVMQDKSYSLFCLRDIFLLSCLISRYPHNELLY